MPRGARERRLRFLRGAPKIWGGGGGGSPPVGLQQVGSEEETPVQRGCHSNGGRRTPAAARRWMEAPSILRAARAPRIQQQGRCRQQTSPRVPHGLGGEKFSPGCVIQDLAAPRVAAAPEICSCREKNLVPFLACPEATSSLLPPSRRRCQQPGDQPDPEARTPSGCEPPLESLLSAEGAQHLPGTAGVRMGCTWRLPGQKSVGLAPLPAARRGHRARARVWGL